MAKKVKSKPASGSTSNLDSESSNKSNRFYKTDYLILSCILLFAYWVYHQAVNCGFVWDDVSYVQSNLWLNKPLGTAIKHFFSFHFVQGNYHPVTMMIYCIIYKFSKLDPTLYHEVNIILHLINTVLVFIFYSFIVKRNSWAAILVSGLFAIHPLHLESVAWISSLKDVLYVFFFLLGLTTYILGKYIQSNKSLKFLTYVFFVCSVLSKPAAVIFPLILILIDYLFVGRIVFNNILQKWLFFVISFGIGVITIIAQKDSIDVIYDYNLFQRLEIGCFAILEYFSKLIFPFYLSALHPLPEIQSIDYKFLFSTIFIIILIWAIQRFLKSERLIIFGLLFFIFSIALMLQFVTVGMAIYAERYSYLSYIGLFIVLVEVIVLIGHKWNLVLQPTIAQFMCFFLILFFGFITYKWVPVWKTNETLWTNVIQNYPRSSIAHYNLGTYYFKETGEVNKAEVSFQKAIQFDPKNITALINLGVIAGNRKDFDLAFNYFEKAKNVDQNFLELYKNRGYVYALSGNTDFAIEDFTKYLKSNIQEPMIFYYRGLLYAQKQSFIEAIQDFSIAISLQPDNSDFYIERAMMYSKLNQFASAKSDAARARALGAHIKPELEQLLIE